MEAVTNRHEEVVQLLLSRGANKNTISEVMLLFPSACILIIISNNTVIYGLFKFWKLN